MVADTKAVKPRVENHELTTTPDRLLVKLRTQLLAGGPRSDRVIVNREVRLPSDSTKEVVQRLLQQASRIGVKPRYLLLDRGFYNVQVVRYLQAARYPFLMPVARRGRKPRDPEKSGSVWRFFAWRRNGFSEHRWRDAAP